MSKVAAPPQRNLGLDLLRLAAIGGVLVLHGYLGFFVATGLSAWTGWRAALSACLAMFSLDWFFVLSGFLIGSMMIRSFETRVGWWASARDFWLRRWFRTLPNYYLFLGINVMLLAWGVGAGRFSWSFALFSQSLAWPQEKPFFYAEAWSLALEEWFYLLMPLLLGAALVARRLSQRDRFWLVAALLIAAPTLLRIAVAPSAHFFEWDDQVRRVAIMHLDSAGWGVAAAIANRWHPAWWSRRPAGKALIGLALMALAVAAMFYFILVDWHAFLGGRFNDLARITAPAAGTALVLPWLAGRARAAPALRALAAHLANYVYSIYLCHYPLITLLLMAVRAMGWEIGSNVGWLVPLWLVLVLALSALIYHGFERPVSNLRERFTRHVQAGPFGAVWQR